MRVELCVTLCVLIVFASADAKKSFSSRRKSGGNSSRRGGNTNHKPPPAPAPASNPHKTDSNNHFLNAERAGSSHGADSATSNTHYRGSPFDSKPSAPQQPKQSVPQTNGPIGFEKVNSDVHHKPNAPAYPVGSPGSPPYPAKPAGAPNGPPPAYGASAPGSHGGFEPPPAYPGRPVNAPPVYSANSPGYHQSPVQQNGYQQSGYPHQQAPYPQQSYSQGTPGQHYNGYQNTGGNYPNQGYPNQGFGSYPNQGLNNNYGGFGNPHAGGFGQPNQGYGGSPFGQPNAYGGSPFGGSPYGQPNHYGGSPFGGGFGGGFGGHGSSYGGFGNNPNYSPNSFGYSNKPGLLGSLFGGGHGGQYSGYGYHKKSRFGGLPIPIPIPIPIPLGGFGMFGGRSHNHRVLDTFVKNQTVNDSDNSTNVYILNNSTVTPCTTDQFIYDSMNVTIMSCTAGNCTAIKLFTTSNISGEVSTHSAGVTMCLEGNTTYSSFADNINPTVSDLHNYWMNVCLDGELNSTSNLTEPIPENITKVSDGEKATTIETVGATPTPNPPAVEPSTLQQPYFERTRISTGPSGNSTLHPSCENFDCSWIEMCLPSVEIVDRCSTPDCPKTKTSYRPCITLKMCKSPSTEISTIATLNNTLTRTDQYNTKTHFNDVANLTLISYIPPVVPTNCSQDATDPSCQLPPVTFPQAPGSSTETVVDGTTSSPTAGAAVQSSETSSVEATTESTTTLSR